VTLDFQHLDLRLTHQWTIARTPGASVLPVIVVKLTDADGTTGLGEAAPVTRYKESADGVASFLRKVDPQRLEFADIPGSMRYLERLSSADMSAKCALNLALHDGAAKQAMKSVYDFLGLGFREQHHLTSFTIGIDKPAVIRKKVLAAAEFPVLKMKVGVPDDKANLQALRDIAPAKTVRVDANEGWATKELALEMIEWLATDGHVEFVEQPMPAANPVKDWAWLKKRSPLPIFGDESYHSAENVSVAVECFHGVNVKLVKTGGISAAFDALQAARKSGLKTMLGCMIETSVLVSAAAHLAGLCDYLDLDGNLLITNDPYSGVTAEKGILSFAAAKEKFGLRVCERGKNKSVQKHS
jgi:L-alanine-DL-glutamate epimerase-like enolase superfamily enzyme